MSPMGCFTAFLLNLTKEEMHRLVMRA